MNTDEVDLIKIVASGCQHKTILYVISQELDHKITKEQVFDYAIRIGSEIRDLDDMNEFKERVDEFNLTYFNYSYTS